MELFQWNEQFVTHIDSVDAQHHHLVDVLNRFIQLMTVHVSLPVGDINEIFDQLADYAVEHFSDEERLMREHGIDPRHLDRHCRQHQNFVNEIRRERPVALASPEGARNLSRFLEGWLAYHILGSDQIMAEQMAAIRAGLSAEQAFARAREKSDDRTQPILQALNRLLEQVMARNSQLVLLNETLEHRVQTRTQDLKAANQRLLELVKNLNEEKAESLRLSREIALANERLRLQAVTDVLTQLPNRRHAIERLEQLFSEAQRHRVDLVCIMVDTDNFKQVNDTWGHDAGDAVLVAIASTLRKRCRNEDLVCRLGGDEFLLLCPQTDLDGGFNLAKRLLAHVNALRVPVGDDEWRGRLSLGVAERRDSHACGNDLMNAADQALYAAKRNGRDQVAIASAAASE